MSQSENHFKEIIQNIGPQGERHDNECMRLKQMQA